ncbi:FG-GAP-like repeat-containing protein [Desulfoluna spongiiphila]|uniref:FG-GAP-like repeat-containing protein n=1 Tax=Desulfoluna spongiiphila TaxID=419481 RepID=UPI001259893F|nr:FG-GAP-like repeat-containing protein [Desulfoluna spongiiphila]VVS94184.1 salmonella virulence plasmid 65kda b protein [Desulfoluna spongiiphila]
MKPNFLFHKTVRVIFIFLFIILSGHFYILKIDLAFAEFDGDEKYIESAGQHLNIRRFHDFFDEVDADEIAIEEVDGEKSIFRVMTNDNSSGEPDNPTTSPYESLPEFGVIPLNGSASTSFRIIIPPGRAGVQPDLRLTYNSSANNDWLGIGWELGLPSISRDTKKGLDYAAKDFKFGSEQLVRRESWGEGAYGFKIEKLFSKFFFDGMTWEMVTKNGMHVFFGESSNSRIGESDETSMVWLLSRVQDSNGNFYKVDYSVDQGTYYLKSIEYTGHFDGTKPANRIEFKLEDRHDSLISYRYGQKVVTSKRLKGIEIYAYDDVPTLKYAFEYQDSVETPLSKIATIQTFGYSLDNNSEYVEKEISKVRAEWNDKLDIDFNDVGVTTSPGSKWPGNLRFADVNGDGKDDMINNDKDGKIYVRLSIGNGEFEPSTVVACAEAGTVIVDDINGDGRADLLVSDKNENTYYSFSMGKERVRFSELKYLGNGPGRDRFMDGTMEHRFFTDSHLADINGDGNLDLIRRVRDSRTNYFVVPDPPSNPPGGLPPSGNCNKCHSASMHSRRGYSSTSELPVYAGFSEKRFIHLFLPGSGQFSPESSIVKNDGYQDPWNNGFWVDLRRDSCSNLIMRYCNVSHNAYDFLLIDSFKDGGVVEGLEKYFDIHNGASKRQYTIRFGDVNGDTLPDLVTNSKDGTIYVYLADGNDSFINEPISHEGNGGNGDSSFWVLDMDLDGYSDLVKQNENGTIYIYRSLPGNAYFEEHPCFSQQKPYSGMKNRIQFADFNGDGRPDILRPDESGNIYCFQASGFGSPQLLTQVSVKNGMSVSLDYSASSDYRQKKMAGKTFVLRRKTVTGEGFDKIETNYRFEDGVYDVLDREFRGFGRITIINPDETRVETLYHQSTILKGLSYESTLLDAYGNLLSRTTTTWEMPVLNLAKTAFFTMKSRERTEQFVGTDVFVQNDFVYDDTNGNLIKQVTTGTDIESVTREFRYSNIGEWLWRKDTESLMGEDSGLLRKTEFSYEANSGNLISKTAWLDDGAEPVTLMSYDDYGNILTTTDPLGNITRTVFDETETYPEEVHKPNTGSVAHVEKTISMDYRFGLPLEIEDENGNRTIHEYDQQGREVRTIYPNGGETRVEFMDDVSPCRVITRKKTQESEFIIENVKYIDGLGRTVQTAIPTVDDCFTITRTFHDTMGRKWKTIGPYFADNYEFDANPSTADRPWYQIDFDGLGRPLSVFRPSEEFGSVQTEFFYDGFATTETDYDGASTTRVKDALDRLIRVVEHGDSDHETLYTYNAVGELLTATNAVGSLTEMTYDRIGRQTTMSDPDMGFWQYTYDVNGNILTQEDAKGETIRFSYDALNRMVSKIYSDGTPSVTWRYDDLSISNGCGRLCEITNSNVTETIDGYNSFGNVLSKSLQISGTPAETFTTRYSYDLVGRLVTTVYPNDYEVMDTYHAGTNLLHQIKGSDGITHATFENYTPFGLYGKVIQGNGTTTDYTFYSESGRVRSILTIGAGGTLQNLAYSYTATGDVSQIHDHLRDEIHAYIYDSLHRLVGEYSTGDGSGISGESSYSSAGFDTLTFSYNGPILHAPDSVDLDGNAYVYTFDANGNMLTAPDFSNSAQDGTRTFTYNGDNMPLTVSVNRGGNISTMSLVYDGEGTRRVKSAAGKKKLYIGSHFEVEKKKGIAKTTCYIFGNDIRIGRITNGERVYYHKDHLGSSTALTDADGNSIETTDYLPFGGSRFEGGETIASYRFTDQELDPESGLYNYNARLYDPVIGMFVAPDFIVPDWTDPQSFNRYAYCRNNPLVYTDPSGHFLVEAVALGVTMWLFDSVMSPCNAIAPTFDTDLSIIQNPTAFEQAGNYISVAGAGLAGKTVGWRQGVKEFGEEVFSSITGLFNPKSVFNFKGPAGRHTLTSVNQKTFVRKLNTVIEPGVDVASDVASINKGLAQKIGDKFIVNGRTYGMHDGTLYPISGPGFHQLDRAAFKALGVFNKFGNTSKANQIINNMGLSQDAISSALKAWRSSQ